MEHVGIPKFDSKNLLHQKLTEISNITRDKGFVWVKKKKLKIDELEIDLGDFEDLE